MEELWKNVKDDDLYQIGTNGTVKNKKKDRPVKPIADKDGYYRVHLHNDRNVKIVSRLVAETYIPNPENKPHVNHKNGDKTNNNVSNLEWNTISENNAHALRIGLRNIERPVRIIETGEVFSSIQECANAIGAKHQNVQAVAAHTGGHKTVQGLHVEYVSDSDFPKKNTQIHDFLYPHQKDAISKMFDGCILNGGVGSGKSRTGLYYYFKEFGGSIDPDYIPMTNPLDLIIISTAKKRNDKEWEAELAPYLLSTNSEDNPYNNKVVVDSWQNIQKYVGIEDTFFIFDEDHVTGDGAWTKAFLKIVKKNRWIILSASPGDKWEDYMAVFIANGFYKNKTEFKSEHLRYDPYCKNFPRVIGYMNEGRLIRLRNKILIDMDFARHTVPHHEDVYVQYDIPMYKDAMRTRWNPFKNEPMKQASDLCYVLRRIVNTDESRQIALLELFEKHPRMIVFYNLDSERDILLNLYYGEDVEVAEYSGHAHQPIPESEKWVYLVQYIAGCEGFNCIKTDTIVFYSQTYSYKTLIQAAGRIDRLNTPYTDLYYYHFKTRSGIDLAISKALSKKKNFNEGVWAKW